MAVAAGTSAVLGRDAECAALDRTLDEVRAGRGAVLVLRGEAGVGKSALLDYMTGRAPAFQVARTSGIESEVELPFAGLRRLLGQMLERAEVLPAPQREALNAAFGTTQGPAPDPFFVALAVLSLLAEAAEERPLLCVVDDMQWLDEASAQVLSFISRRLAAEPIALVFAVRDVHAPLLDGLPRLSVEGLSDDDARRLFESAVPGGIDAQVRDRMVAETHGNPLALLELPRALTPAELAGGFSFAGTSGLAGRLEESFLRRIGALPDETQTMLLLAAAESVGDMMLLKRAADDLGIAGDALTPAQAAGLVELSPRVRFRHPLVRSAAYRNATPDERRRVHGALARSTDPQVEPDRRAWHHAHAVVDRDESVAAELERSASRARARGGTAAAAAFLARAAELTPDPAHRGQRALAAAQAKFDAGAPDAAEAMLESAAAAPIGDLERAHVGLLRARIAFARTRGSTTPALLSAAARDLEPLDPELAREAHLEALWAGVRSGRFAKPTGVLEAAEAAVAPSRGTSSRAIDLLLEGLTTRLGQGYSPALPSLGRALDAFQEEGFRRENIVWCWLACQLAMDLWNDNACAAIATGLTDVARDRGALAVLPFALNYSAAHRLFAGEFDVAEQLVAEAQAITTATSGVPLADFSVLLAAWRGDRESTYAAANAAIEAATSRGEGFAVEVAQWGIATLHLGLGEYAEAAAAAAHAYDQDGLGFNVWILPELIEAAVRTGDVATARTAYERLAERSSLSSTPWARGIEARSRALLSDGPAAERNYVEAIEHLSRSQVVVHHARAELIYGEWLRREDRRMDARLQLRSAYSALDAMGAAGFAERARSELAATGQSARGRTAAARDALTPQEAQIARMATEGRANPEIATQLFLSGRTVDWHLDRVYAKLGITSRNELAQALGGAEAVSA
jgi:DNA-binding CsgD family transcriptional regulator